MRVWYNTRKPEQLPDTYAMRYDAETGQPVEPVAAL